MLRRLNSSEDQQNQLHISHHIINKPQAHLTFIEYVKNNY